MKYKVGDKVRIKSFDWHNENKDGNGHVECGTATFDANMQIYCGSITTIYAVDEIGYDLDVDWGQNVWTDEMIEGLVEEENEKKLSDESWRYKNIFDHSQYPQSFECPEGYIFKDENGNIINATKIVLEKKKEYPKTFEECVHVLEGENRMSLEQMNTFRKLIDARNAYWKIAGEEMGLGKPWEPDYKNPDIDLYVIINSYNQVNKEKYGYGFPVRIFTFPTEEMRDTFYENFKEEIEICKELL